jgi:hypothetical protein
MEWMPNFTVTEIDSLRFSYKIQHMLVIKPRNFTQVKW